MVYESQIVGDGMDFSSRLGGGRRIPFGIKSCCHPACPFTRLWRAYGGRSASDEGSHSKEILHPPLAGSE